MIKVIIWLGDKKLVLRGLGGRTAFQTSIASSLGTVVLSGVGLSEVLLIATDCNIHIATSCQHQDGAF